MFCSVFFELNSLNRFLICFIKLLLKDSCCTQISNMLSHLLLKNYKGIYDVDRLIGLVSWVFAIGPGDMGSIPRRVIPKTLEMVLDSPLLNTRQYKVRIKGKIEQFMERSIPLPLHFGVVAMEKRAFWSSSITVANL